MASEKAKERPQRLRKGYRHRMEPQENAELREPDDFVVQINDEGTFWDPSVAQRAVQTIADVSANSNTIVTIFIHGWHHNAHPDDGDVRRFVKSQRDLRTKLELPLFKESRRVLTGDSGVKVIGIYVGWRGRSLPGVLDYLTVWGRHVAAKNVGSGTDLRQFLADLQAIYLKRNSPAGGNRLFLGLVSAGHSFGGQVLFSGVQPLMDLELLQARAPAEQKRPLQGFGDLTVLINPALEASQYAPIHDGSRAIEHKPSQVPVMLVMSSENDLARRIAFPLKQIAARLVWGKLRRERGWASALGESKSQRTHRVELAKSASGEFAPTFYEEGRERILQFDLTNIPCIGGVTLRPLEGHQAFNPFLVAWMSKLIVFGHSDFKDVLYAFLTNFAAIAQGKRMLLRAEVNGEADLG